MKPFAYERPSTLLEAVALLDGSGGSENARPLAGGTDLLPLMKEGIATPERLIDLKRLIDLDDAIELTTDGVTIGALATLDEIERSPFLHGPYAALAQAAGLAASPQLRNMATIGGNLLQRPRCWYFRDREVNCWLKGGDDCPAVEGEHQLHAIFDASPCRAVHPSDPATALLALDASVIARGGAEARDVPISDFFALPTDERRTENTLGPDELIVAITLPDRAESWRSVYLKSMDRAVWAFALVGVAVALDIQSGEIADARIALGGVAPIPIRATAAESLVISERPSAARFAQAAERALAEAAPLPKNGYKVELAKTLIRRALSTAAAGA
jgi:xanthine dehydrogenase YagS FAD-binding subunit